MSARRPAACWTALPCFAALATKKSCSSRLCLLCTSCYASQALSKTTLPGRGLFMRMCNARPLLRGTCTLTMLRTPSSDPGKPSSAVGAAQQGCAARRGTAARAWRRWCAMRGGPWSARRGPRAPPPALHSGWCWAPTRRASAPGPPKPCPQARAFFRVEWLYP